MKKRLALLFASLLLLTGCGKTTHDGTTVAATTAPVYQFTLALCQGTDIHVDQVISESVSCVHDYSLTVRQMQALENADAVVISGAGLEDFMADAIGSKPTIDCSSGIELLCSEHDHDHAQEAHGHEEEAHEEAEHDHEEEAHEEEDHHDHDHGEFDPHIWLDPENAMIMAQNICAGLSALYPDQAEQLESNLQSLLGQLTELQAYGQTVCADLAVREMITFHDGFGYLAESLHLDILAAIEEEPGAEATAQELIHIIDLVQEHEVPVIFTEVNGSSSAAGVIHREIGTGIYTLDMGMSGADYFDLMRKNYDTIKEALG